MKKQLNLSYQFVRKNKVYWPPAKFTLIYIYYEFQIIDIVYFVKEKYMNVFKY